MLSNQRKTDKLDFIKMKSFCVLKDTNKKGKRQTTEWENISANHIPDKGLILRIYKGLINNSTIKYKKPD